MADQDKDSTSPVTGHQASPGMSSANLSGSTQQRTSAFGTSAGNAFASGESDNAKAMDGAGMSSHTGSSGSANDIKQSGQQVMQEAKQYTQDMAQHAKEQGRTMFEQQKDAAAQQVDSAAHAFRNTAKQLEGEGQSQTGHYVSMLAEQLEALGSQLRQKNLDTLLRDAEELGRRSPGVFLAGSVAAGFLLARFLKSSAQHRYEPSRHDSADRLHRDWGTHAPHADSVQTTDSSFYSPASSDMGSAPVRTDSPMSGSSTVSGLGSSGASAMGGADLSGGPLDGSAIGSATPTGGTGLAGTSSDTTRSPSSSATSTGGNTYDKR